MYIHIHETLYLGFYFKHNKNVKTNNFSFGRAMKIFRWAKLSQAPRLVAPMIITREKSRANSVVSTRRFFFF